MRAPLHDLRAGFFLPVADFLRAKNAPKTLKTLPKTQSGKRLVNGRKPF
jgi:hypothetical protein